MSCAKVRSNMILMNITVQSAIPKIIHLLSTYLNRVNRIINVAFNSCCVVWRILWKLSNSQWWVRHVVVVVVTTTILGQGPAFTCPGVSVDWSAGNRVDLPCPATWCHPLVHALVSWWCIYHCASREQTLAVDLSGEDTPETSKKCPD